MKEPATTDATSGYKTNGSTATRCDTRNTLHAYLGTDLHNITVECDDITTTTNPANRSSNTADGSRKEYENRM